MILVRSALVIDNHDGETGERKKERYVQIAILCLNFLGPVWDLFGPILGQVVAQTSYCLFLTIGLD